MKKSIKYPLDTVALSIASILIFCFCTALPTYALTASAPSGPSSSPSGGKLNTVASNSPYSCGGPNDKVVVSIDIGCQHKGNPILDLTFAIIKLLSDGVGLVVIASLIVAGIQYTSSRGDPQSTQKAIQRIQSNVIALLIFFFAYALLNYVVPGQVLK